MPAYLAAHGSHLLYQVEVKPHALALGADNPAGTQRAVHVLEERLPMKHISAIEKKWEYSLRTLVKSTDAGPTGSDESTIMASYEPASAS